MATDRNIVELIQALRNTKTNKQLLIAHVNSVNPVTLKLYDLIVNKNIYINESFISSTYNIDKIKKGDCVIVFQEGISFYVLERVVKVA